LITVIFVISCREEHKQETALDAKEKVLDEKLKVDQVFKMVAKFYRKSPMRGLTPIPNRAPTPPLKKKSQKSLKKSS
jgi:hypothetical protein